MNKKIKKENKSILVCIRVSENDRLKIKEAAKKVRSKWLTFIRSATLKEAGKILNG